MIALAAAGLLMGTASGGLAQGARDGVVPDGGAPLPPVMASRVAPVRTAVVIAPDDPLAPGSETIAYRDTLRLLGFEVTLVTAATRPGIDAAVRAVPPSTSDVAVIVVGRIAPDGRDLYVLPAGADAEVAAPLLPTEGLRLATILRRLMPRGGELAAVAEGCRDRTGGVTCSASLGTFPAGASLAVVAQAGNAGVGIRQELVPLLEQEGLSFADLVAALTPRTAVHGLQVAAATPLSRTFTFLPAGFLAGLPLGCNEVDPAMSAGALLQAPPLDALVTACGEAARRYAFSSFFAGRLAAVREQRIAQAALVGCDTPKSAAYLDVYPDGRYRDAIAAAGKKCAAPPPAVAPASLPPSPPPALNPLQGGAAAAVADYFRRHDYEQGGSFGELVRLYPPRFREGRSTVSRNDHLRDLGAWYGGFDSVRFEIVPDTLDASGCLRNDDCLVRGTVRARMLKSGDSQYAWEEDRFVLRLDLAATLVLAECGVAGPASSKAETCD